MRRKPKALLDQLPPRRRSKTARKTVACLLWGIASLAQTTTTEPDEPREVSIRDFGARGDGTTNDTAAIRKAIETSCSGKSASTIVFPAGIYLISPVNPATPILPVCSDLVITGSGTLKIADNAGSYYSIFDRSTRSVLNNFHLSNLTIDLNSANNPVPSAESFGKFPRIVLRTGPMGNGGQNNTVDHVHVTDIRSEWVFFITSSNSGVTESLLDKVGGGLVDTDSSLIYCESGAAGCNVKSNTVIASFRGANMARTAIEVQDTASVIDNHIQDMLTGENLVGASASTVSGTRSRGNIIAGAYNCIVLWSNTGRGATRYGLTAAEVQNNICRINQRSFRNIGGAMSGITLVPTANLPFANLKINDNFVSFDLSDNDTDPINNSSIGIGYWDSTNSNRCDDCDFSRNIVVDAPATAYRFAANGSNIRFDDEVAINPGSSLNANLAEVYRSGLLLGNLKSIDGFISIKGGTYRDILPISRMAYGVAIASGQASKLLVDGPVLSCSDPKCASVRAAILTNASTTAALIRATVDVPNAAALPNSAPAPQSIIYSVRDQLDYLWDGSSWAHVASRR
jgi:hypothetical protein